jgi:hypothetical protein
VRSAIVPLTRLEQRSGASPGLRGRFVVVRNGCSVNALDPESGGTRPEDLGDAQADEAGDFLFEPGQGGSRLDKIAVPGPNRLRRYTQAARFGEVNAYFHLDRIAAYVDGLLQELAAVSIPRVIAIVNAHPAITEQDGVRDGVRRPSGRWFPFQGGHYRLPSGRGKVVEHSAVCPTGEIHLGPGWMLLDHGALVEASGVRYRANASHNAPIVYHEYGHHIARHTADFAANVLRRPDRQRNGKAAIEEGTCDYWTATLLEVPHIWAWHRRHDAQAPHRRCLTSAKTMRDYDPGPDADPHANGTIWGAALWDLRTHLRAIGSDGARMTDLLLLKALLLLGTLKAPEHEPAPRGLSRLRASFPAGLAALVHADELLCAGQHRDSMLNAFALRGIQPDKSVHRMLSDRSRLRRRELDPRPESSSASPGSEF